jgi:integrative and conjugative element protein (TIGR02256 family)
MARRRAAKGREVLVQPRYVVWVSQQVYDQCAKEAALFYPLETGGALMGYWCGPCEAVATASIPAGPAAHHRKTSFEPDQNWQLQQIAAHYGRSGRMEIYLGDWHTHPGARSGILSCTDRRVLRRVIQEPKARAPQPLSVVFYGSGRKWAAQVWVATMGHRRVLGSALIVSEALFRVH